MVPLRETWLLSAEFGRNSPASSLPALLASACYITNFSHDTDPVPSWHWSFRIEQRQEILKGKICDFYFTERNKFLNGFQSEGSAGGLRGRCIAQEEGKVEPGTFIVLVSLFLINWETRAECQSAFPDKLE